MSSLFKPKLLIHLIKANGKSEAKRFWKVTSIAENKALIEVSKPDLGKNRTGIEITAKKSIRQYVVWHRKWKD